MFVASLAACEFDPDIEPLVLPTAPPQAFSARELEEESSTDLSLGVAEQQAPQGLESKTEPSQIGIGIGGIVFTAAISIMALAGLRFDRLGPCIIDGVLTVANGAGTLLVATGVGIGIGTVLLGANAIAQVLQILSGNAAFQAGEISRQHYYFNLGMDILDAIPGVGVLSGIFGLMGTCVFDWAFEFSSSSPD